MSQRPNRKQRSKRTQRPHRNERLNDVRPPNHEQLMLYRLVNRLRILIPKEIRGSVTAWILNDHEGNEEARSRLSKIARLGEWYNRLLSDAARAAFVEELLNLGNSLQKESA